MISLKDVSYTEKKKKILENINIDFFQDSNVNIIYEKNATKPGEITKLLFKCNKQYTGKIIIDEIDINKINDNDYRQEVTTFIFNDNNLLSHLTIFENLKLLTGATNLVITNELLKFDLLEYRDLKVKNIPQQEIRKILIIRALISNAKYLIFDNCYEEINEEELNYLIEKIANSNKYSIILTKKDYFQDIGYPIYEVENYSIKKTKNSIKKNINNELNKRKLKLTSLKYQVKLLAKNFLNIILNNFLYICLLLVFIFSSIIISENFVVSKDYIENKITDSTIIINLDSLKNKNSSLERNDIENLYISNQQVDSVRSLENIKDTYLYNTHIISAEDQLYNKLNLELKTDDLSTKISKKLIGKTKKIDFSFRNIPLPANHMKEYNQSDLKILYGEFPISEYDILIPDIYANFLTKNSESLIGEKVELPIINEKNIDDYKKYVIRGIYKTNYLNTIEPSYKIYLSNRDFSILPEKINYETDIKIYGNIFDDFDTWKSKIKTGYKNILINVNSQDNIPIVFEQLEAIFPKVDIITKTQLETNNRDSFKWLCLIISILILIQMITFYMSNKNYFRKKKKYTSLLYMCGYSKKKLFLGIFWENIIITLFCFLTTYLIITIIQFSAFLPIDLNILLGKIFTTEYILLFILVFLINLVIINSFEIMMLRNKSILKDMKNN